MSKMCKITNLNEYVFETEFKGEYIKIEPGKYIMMEENEAKDFLKRPSTIHPFHKVDGVQPPQTFMKLKAEFPKDAKKEKAKLFKCNVCREEFATESSLNKHIKDEHGDMELMTEEP